MLDVTRRVARMVEEDLGIKVALTRSTDVFVPLRDRTNFANKQRADLFVSIHANAHPRAVSEGVETYFLSSEASDTDARQVAAVENGVIQLETPASRAKGGLLKSILWDLAQSEFQQESSFMAETVQDSMTRSLSLVNRGVKQAGFYVLGGAAMPAILIEIGFLTNPKEEKKLATPAYRESVARAIYAGLSEYKRRYDQRLRHGRCSRERHQVSASIIPRHDGRRPDQLRPVTIIRDYLRHPEGSVLVSFGDTKVHLHGVGRGEGAAVPEGPGPGMGHGGVRDAAALHQYPDVPRARTGRAAARRRSSASSAAPCARWSSCRKLGERTIWVDCDVIQADGGTRTAAITGAFVALADAVGTLLKSGACRAHPSGTASPRSASAWSAGRAVLDLDYVEDSTAEVDMNVVMTGAGAFVEVQGTAEQTPFSKARLDELLALAGAGIARLVALQRRAREARGETTFTL